MLKFRSRASRLCFQLKSFYALSIVSLGLNTQVQAADVVVGVNVNSFQNFSAAQQQDIVNQLKRSKVKAVRTTLRLDPKDLNLAKQLQDEGIGWVCNEGFSYLEGSVVRPEQDHVREGRPLSAIDVDACRTRYKKLFDALDAAGIKLVGLEVGNEINWVDFNADFTTPGQGRSFNFQDLSTDTEAKQVALGFLRYLEVLKEVKIARDQSKLNRTVPIIASGMAAIREPKWQKRVKMDCVAIPATYKFLIAHGLDSLVDGYGVHVSPPYVDKGDREGLATREKFLDERVFPPVGTKPFWLTEWGFPSKANDDSEDQNRIRSVDEIRDYLNRIANERRLAGIFWYVWNEPSPNSIFRQGNIMEAGRKAVAPFATAR